jgi:hypothetical protein
VTSRDWAAAAQHRKPAGTVRADCRRSGKRSRPALHSTGHCDNLLLGCCSPVQGPGGRHRQHGLCAGLLGQHQTRQERQASKTDNRNSSEKKLCGRWVHLTTDAPLHSIGDSWQRKRSSAHGRVARPTHLSAPCGRSGAVSGSTPSAVVQPECLAKIRAAAQQIEGTMPGCSRSHLRRPAARRPSAHATTPRRASLA